MVMPMVSLELDEDAQCDAPYLAGTTDKPKYPSGCYFSIDEKALEKLGIDMKDLFVGGIMHMHALVNITGIQCQQTASGQTCRVDLCIENMAIESEDMENEDGSY